MERRGRRNDRENEGRKQGRGDRGEETGKRRWLRRDG